MGELGVRGWAEYASLWGPSVEGQREEMFPTFTIWGRPVKIQDPVAQGVVETQCLKLSDEFGGYYGVKC